MRVVYLLFGRTWVDKTKKINFHYKILNIEIAVFASITCSNISNIAMDAKQAFFLVQAMSEWQFMVQTCAIARMV